MLKVRLEALGPCLGPAVVWRPLLMAISVSRFRSH